MLGSTAFIFGEDTRLQRERTINKSLEERKVYHPNTLLSSVYEFFVSNIYVTCGSLYLIWTAIGIVFYTYYNEWTPATAYYYAMEAGLSIGFCNPVEKDDWSKLFTIFYVLCGSIIISGTVGLFASSLMFNTTPVIRVQRKDILRRSQVKFNVSGSVYYDKMDSLSFSGITRYCWYHIKYYLGWYSNRFRAIITFLLILWVAFGIIYCMVVENWTFITSLYWAITTYSTGGLQSATCEDNTNGTNCNMGDMRGSIMGFLMMVGVPIYALAFGQYARLFIQKTIKYREQELLNRPIEDAEFLFAANILSPEGSETLVLGEYILLELMRLGITNKRQIELMKKKFHDLDHLSRGEIDIEDLKQAGKVVTNKKEKDRVMIDI